jgi:hypothetical protein
MIRHFLRDDLLDLVVDRDTVLFIDCPEPLGQEFVDPLVLPEIPVVPCR